VYNAQHVTVDPKNHAPVSDAKPRFFCADQQRHIIAQTCGITGKLLNFLFDEIAQIGRNAREYLCGTALDFYRQHHEVVSYKLTVLQGGLSIARRNGHNSAFVSGMQDRHSKFAGVMG
jgi:hypothetical protein